MKISEIITDKYKLRIPPTVYYELLADVQEVEEDQEPTTKNNLSSELEKTRKKLEKDFGELDCISRKRAIERLKLNFPISQGADNSRDRHRYMQALADLQAIKELPSVTPIRPKGHWIEEFNDIEGEVRFTCSSCGKYQLFGTDFCYNCGSDNREVEE